MDRINKTLLLVALLLDRWDDLPNDVKSEPELEPVAKVIGQIAEIVDDDSKDDDA
jgi:hypothetical protein